MRVTSPAGTSPVSSADKYAYVVPFRFAGFFLPVLNPPAVNLRIAGLPVNMGFALGGNKGLNVIAAGYPQVQQDSCTTGAPTGPPQAATTVANNGASPGRPARPPGDRHDHARRPLA
ncbi:MAG TPA: PxKF domain-containing protein [Trebonia sp.]